MAFPAIAAENTNTTASGTSHTVNLPASIAAGNLLFVIIGASAAATFTWPTGWTSVVNAGTGGTLAAGYRIANGTESSTITVTTGATSVTTISRAYRITGAEAIIPEAGTNVTVSNSATGDPPALTPSWGSMDTLWFAASYATTQTTVSTYPTSYTNTAVLANGSTGLATCNRNNTVSSENPAAYTWGGTGRKNTNTFGVKPGNPIVPSVGSITASGVASINNSGVISTAGSASITGNIPGILNPVSITPSVGSLILSGNASTLLTNTVITPTVGSLTIVGIAPTVDQSSGPVDTAITPSTASLTITGNTPIIGLGIVPSIGEAWFGTPNPGLFPSVYNLSFSGNAPNVSTNISITPSVGAAWFGLPYVDLPLDCGNLNINGSTPNVLQGTVITPSVGTLSISGVAPTNDLGIYASLGKPANLVFDTFNGADQLDLADGSYTRDDGGTWTMTDSSANGSNWRLFNGRAHFYANIAASDYATYRANQYGPFSSKIRLSFQFLNLFSDSSTGVRFYVRWNDNNGGNGYELRHDKSTNSWQLFEWVNGSSTSIGSSGYTLSNSVVYNGVLTITDSTKNFNFQGTDIITSSNNNAVGAGDKFYLFGHGAQGNGAGYHFESLLVEDLYGAGGVLSLLGNTSTVVQGTVITPSVGSLSISGVAPTVQESGGATNTNITPPVGSLSITGSGSTLDFGLTSTVSSLTIAGNTPTLIQDIRITPTVGSLTLSGNTSEVIQSTVITPTVGSLTIAGNTPTLIQDIRITPTVGSLTITGNTPSVVESGSSNTSITPNTGILTLTGNSSTLDFGLISTVGSLTLSGNAPTLVQDIRITPTVGSLTITGNTPTLVQGIIITPTVGSITFSSDASTLVQGTILTPTVGSLTLSGNTPTLIQGTIVTPSVGSLTLNGNTPILIQDIRITPTIGSLTFTGNAPSVEISSSNNTNRTPSTGSLSISGNAPSILVSVSAQPGTGTLSFTQNNATIIVGTNLTVPASTLTINGNTSSLIEDIRLTPNTGTLSVNENTSTLVLGTIIEPSVGTLTLDSTNPTVPTGSLLTPSTGSLSINSNAVSLDLGLITSTTNISITGNPPVLQFGNTLVTPQSGTLVLNGVTPTVNIQIVNIIKLTSINLKTPLINTVTLKSSYIYNVELNLPTVDDIQLV